MGGYDRKGRLREALAIGGFVLLAGMPFAMADEGYAEKPSGVSIDSWLKVNPASDVPAPRSVHRSVFDENLQKVLLFGGQPAGSPLPVSDTYTWDGQDWKQLLIPGKTPPARKNFGIAFDSSRSKTVVFGGISGGFAAPQVHFQDVWEFDGQRWSQVYPESIIEPDKRAGHAMAYDAALKKVVMFGGLNDLGEELGDTWTWDGKTWEKLEIVSSPPPRLNAQMFFDVSRGYLVMFGGQTVNNPLQINLADTWILENGVWREVAPANKNSPGGRGFYAMTYDSRRQGVVMFGGSTSFPPIFNPHILEDFWYFDGKAWQEIDSNEIGTPGNRAGHSLSYDFSHDELVLFGGKNEGYVTADTFVLSDRKRPGGAFENMGFGLSCQRSYGESLSGTAEDDKQQSIETCPESAPLCTGQGFCTQRCERGGFMYPGPLNSYPICALRLPSEPPEEQFALAYLCRLDSMAFDCPGDIICTEPENWDGSPLVCKPKGF